ncbi:hypothetical protein NDU88_004570 [Pleurodeles waltl]|uniref:Secreted protein n=1 Tax=Pleurodeles waltl TaxID=8319 RepID=A0AAV7V1F9_PLEWA|nr:hypothetical protein NDU88_004570 [Pleurodeles waltl]
MSLVGEITLCTSSLGSAAWAVSAGHSGSHLAVRPSAAGRGSVCGRGPRRPSSPPGFWLSFGLCSQCRAGAAQMPRRAAANRTADR